MSTGRTYAIAEAVKSLLNTGAASPTFAFGNPVPFTAARKYAPIFDTAQLQELKVTVLGVGKDEEFMSRSQIDCDQEIQVWIQKALQHPEDSPEQAEELDGLTAKAEAIGDYLKNIARRRITSGAVDVILSKFRHDPLVSPAHLREKGTFTSVLRLTYRDFTKYR